MYLVSEYGQPLLERQLEPVSAGDSVSRPVVKVLMCNNTLDASIVAVRGSCRGSQHQAGVENVEGFVFHCTHVEVVDCHDVEEVQIVLQTCAQGVCPNFEGC